jgi:hypothetical protein
MGRNGRAVVAGLVVGVFVAVGALAPDLSLLWSIVAGAVVGAARRARCEVVGSTSRAWVVTPAT